MSGNLSTNLIISGIILIIAVTFMVIFLPMLSKPDTKLWLGDGIFNIDIASTNSERVQGLSGRSGLAADQALLMVFPSEGKWGIWMKGMNFPIDIVWLNKNKKVIYIVKDAPFDDQATVYTPPASALYVVELPAGTASSKSITTNNIAIFQINPGVIN
jgi:uncharacterized membrane protein (UPF0127 family)